jgi:hypothetical protein
LAGLLAMASGEEPWMSGGWRRLPFWTLAALFGAAAAATMAAVILTMADNQPVDTWTISPTVYLSVIATLSNTFLRHAFRSSSDSFWWSQLLSDPGVSIRELQSLWDIAYNPTSILKASRPHIRTRSAALFVILLAVNGPLLQRAVTVEVEID